MKSEIGKIYEHGNLTGETGKPIAVEFTDHSFLYFNVQKDQTRIPMEFDTETEISKEVNLPDGY